MPRGAGSPVPLSFCADRLMLKLDGSADMRLILALAAAAVMLSGCNMVYSERPLFAPRDARGAPVLRTGLWVKPKLDCKYDASKPAAAIDECAEPLVITSYD